jgi:hypothetical protein
MVVRENPSQEVECPQCAARWFFRRSSLPLIDSSGFESYELDCADCEAALIGIIDPFGDKLLLSKRFEGPRGGSAANEKLPGDQRTRKATAAE